MAYLWQRWVLFAGRNLGAGASLGPKQEILVVSNTNETKRRSWVVIAISVAVAFVVLAFGGSFYVSHHMNKTADIHNMSAGRPGDAYPNRINEQSAASARGRSTSGRNPKARSRRDKPEAM